MKINLKELKTEVIESTVTNDVKMRLSENASSMVFQLFTKNVYSNPIGTVVREITSNCFDSHIEAKVNAPVLIKKHYDTQAGTHYISFIDYGVGMNPDRVENIYGVYFESTKRVDNEQIGGFGIGAKSILAYKRSTGQGEGEYDNSFYVITVFDKVKYFYCIYEGNESPMISLIHEEPTTEKNGTEIRVPVLEKDVSTFAKEMVRQLYYFENIVFQGFDDTYQHETLTNDYQIIRGKNFLFRGNDYSEKIHVCLGKVAYPIDYDALGLYGGDYQLPIALKLNVGDIGVTVSRESLDYSEATIKMLKKKLESAKQEIINLITKQYDNIVTLKQYFNVKHDFDKLVFPNNISLSVGNLIKQKDIDFSNFKYQFTKMPNDKQLFNFFFKTKSYGKKKPRNSWNNNYFEGGYDDLFKKDNLLYIENNLNRKIIKQAYLKHKFKTYHIISKRVIDKWMCSDIADVFNVHINDVVDDKGKILPFIQELINMQEEYFDIVRENIINYDELIVPEDFVLSRKRNAGITPELRKQTIPVKIVNDYLRERIKLSTLFDYNMPIFYGTSDDEYILKEAVKLYRLLFDSYSHVNHVGYDGRLINNGSAKKSITFIQIAKNNIKYMEYCKKAKPIQDFFKYMLLRKTDMVLEYFQTYQVIERYEDIDKFYKKGFINKIDEKWGEKIEVIKAIFDTIPNDYKYSQIKAYRTELSRYFKIDNIKLTKEQSKFIKLVGEVEELQNKNNKTLDFFNIPYDAEDLDEEQITILQLAMDLT
jgi:hypothetical protein